MYTNELEIDSRSSTVFQTCKAGNTKGTGSVHIIWRAPYIVIIDLEIEIRLGKTKLRLRTPRK